MLLVSDTLEGRGGIGGTSGLAGAELSSDWSAVTTPFNLEDVEVPVVGSWD